MQAKTGGDGGRMKLDTKKLSLNLFKLFFGREEERTAGDGRRRVTEVSGPF